MVKAVTLFLIVIVALALFGKLRLVLPSKWRERVSSERRGRFSVERCAGCGRPRIGRGPCSCGKA
jgi:hypothetical protein